MVPREGDGVKGDWSEEEEREHRRSRLWLGYSEDNLLNAEHLGKLDPQPLEQQNASGPGQQPAAIPSEYGKLDEVEAPPPVGSSRRDSRQNYLGKRTTSAKSTGPDALQNLDEVAAPPPIEKPQEDREQGYLEDAYGDLGSEKIKSPPGNFEHLDEFPQPVAARGEKNGGHDEHMVDGERDIPSRTRTSLRKNTPSALEEGEKLATQFYTVTYLILFSILGTLARLGLQALTFYPGAPVQTGLLWANLGGSLLMGFLAEDRKLFQSEETILHSKKTKDEEQGRLHRSPSANARHMIFKQGLPLYIGLTTGFCGSFTSFSSFIRDAYFALANALPVPIQHPSSAPISQSINVHRNPGYSFLALLAVLIVTVGLSLVALNFGAHVALFLETRSPSIPALFIRRYFDRCVVFLALGCWLAAILMAALPPDRPGGPVGNASWAQETWRSQALFALVFAPLGCLLRFYVSIHLNGKLKAFPLGTFAVNTFGTAMEAIFVDLQRVPVGGMVGCQVLQGMSDGFCGCLTTVSTWVIELTALRLRHAYSYGLMSVAVGLSLFVIITGSLQWSRGFAHPLCMS